MIVEHALAGVPPVGLGIYTRDRVEPGPWAWRAVDPRIRGGEVARAARAHGPIWLFAGPDAWRAETWRGTLARLLGQVGEFGAAGIIANPEAGWDGVGSAEFVAFGRALHEASYTTRVGVVTIPSWRGLRDVAAAAGRRVWWSPEFYSQYVTEADVPGWWSRWRSIVGVRLIPTIAAFQPPRDDDATLATAGGYRRYLESIPRAGGAIVWPTYPIRPYMLDALRARYAGLSLPLLMPGAALASLEGPGVLAALAFVLVLGALAFVSKVRG